MKRNHDADGEANMGERMDRAIRQRREPTPLEARQRQLMQEKLDLAWQMKLDDEREYEELMKRLDPVSWGHWK